MSTCNKQIHVLSIATATTEIYTLSLHDALPIYHQSQQPPEEARRSERARGNHPQRKADAAAIGRRPVRQQPLQAADRKSTRLNSSHSQISYAVFCLKKKKKVRQPSETRCSQMPS